MNRLDVKRVAIQAGIAGSTGATSRSPLAVRWFMTTAPSCIDASTSVLDLIKLFHRNGFRHLLVTDAEDRLLGVLSDRDVSPCLGPDAPKLSVLTTITAAQLMSTDLVTVHPETSLTEAVTLMVEHGISCLPVLVDEKLVGILTNTDLHLVLEALLARSPALLEQPA